MRLGFAAGLLRRVERPVEDLYAALRIRLIAIGSVGSKSSAHFLDILWSAWLPIEIPSTELNAHTLLPFPLLASVDDCEYFRHIYLVVHHVAFDFDPSVGLERHLLRANDHVSGYAIPLQKTSQGCRTLKAKCLLPIPNTRHVHCGTDLLNGTRNGSFLGDRVAAHFVVKRGEIVSRQIEVELNQVQVRFQH